MFKRIMKYEHYKTFDLVNNFIKFSDVKAGVIITFDMTLTAAILAKADKFQILELLSCSKFIYISACSGYFIFILLSITNALISVHPSLKASGRSSNIYFRHIAEKSIEEFKTEIREHSGYVYEDDLISQIKINSDICWKKYRRISWSIKFTAVAIICLVISLVFVLAI